MICPSTAKVWWPETIFAVGWPTSVIIGISAATFAFVVVVGATTACVAVAVVEAVADEAGEPVDVLLPHAANKSKSSSPKNRAKDV